MKKGHKFFSVIFLQIGFLIAIGGPLYWISQHGESVLLRIEPVDPSDPLRGDYITFRYTDIAEVSTAKRSYQSPLAQYNFFEKGETVFVTLRQSEDFWYAARIGNDKPEREDVFLRGRVQDVREDDEVQRVNVLYGIEEYFIPENSGRGVSFAQKEVIAKVRVDKDGNAVLNQIYINGEKWPQ